LLALTTVVVAVVVVVVVVVVSGQSGVGPCKAKVHRVIVRMEPSLSSWAKG